MGRDEEGCVLSRSTLGGLDRVRYAMTTARSSDLGLLSDLAIFTLRSPNSKQGISEDGKQHERREDRLNSYAVKTSIGTIFLWFTRLNSNKSLGMEDG
jgi:hypothetical protein